MRVPNAILLPEIVCCRLPCLSVNAQTVCSVVCGRGGEGTHGDRGKVYNDDFWPVGKF